MPNTKNHVVNLEYIISRYRIEPRCAYLNRSASWLVVYDRETCKYIHEEGKKSYKRFNNSDEIYNFLCQY